MAAKTERVSAQQEPTEEDKDRIGTLDSIMAQPEIEVGQVEEVAPAPSGTKTVVIRVNQDIEDMSIVAGGRRNRYTFVAGKQYRVPVNVWKELERTGKVWH